MHSELDPASAGHCLNRSRSSPCGGHASGPRSGNKRTLQSSTEAWFYPGSSQTLDRPRRGSFIKGLCGSAAESVPPHTTPPHLDSAQVNPPASTTPLDLQQKETNSPGRSVPREEAQATVPLPAAAASSAVAAAVPCEAVKPRLMFGRSSLARHLVTELNPAQTIAEAQERGEHVQVLDAAVYALDGMQPTASLGTQRDSMTSLAELMATRRGRAVLRSDSMTQQVLTAAAKLRGQADPVIALASSCLLLSLSLPDAHPSYLASSAAAVLTSQLLQAQHDVAAIMTDGAVESRDRPHSCGGGHAADPGLRPALARILQVACEGQLGQHLAAELKGIPGAACGSGRSLPHSHLPLVLLTMSQATSTDSSRIHFSNRIKHNLRKVKALKHLASLAAFRIDRLTSLLSPSSNKTEAAPLPPSSHQPPDRQLRVAAAAAGQQQQPDRQLIKATVPYCQHASYFPSSPPVSSVNPIPPPSASQSQCCSGSRSRVTTSPLSRSRFRAAKRAGDEDAVDGCVVSTPAKAGPGTNPIWDFPCDDDSDVIGPCGCKQTSRRHVLPAAAAASARGAAESAQLPARMALDGRGSLRVRASGEANASATAPKPVEAGGLEPPRAGMGKSEGGMKEGGGALVAHQEVERLLIELQMCFSVLENVTFTCLENEDEVLNLQVAPPKQPILSNVTVPSQDSSVRAACDERPFTQLVVLLMQLLAPQLLVSTLYRTSVGHCLQAAVGLLMNLTHQHERGVQAVVQAGALGALAALVQACCCLPEPEAESLADPCRVMPPASTACESEAAPASPLWSLIRRDIMCHLDLITVCLGLLINVTSLSIANRELLRVTLLPGRGGRAHGATLHGDKGDVRGCVFIPMLCNIFEVMASDADMASGGAGGAGGQRTLTTAGREVHAGFSASARALRQGSSQSGYESEREEGQHVEVTAEDLHEDHQDGEAAIVQAYAAMLLGFLIVDSEVSRSQACELLVGSNFTRVKASIRRCLGFYTYTGAITEQCKASLLQLLSNLDGDHA